MGLFLWGLHYGPADQAQYGDEHLIPAINTINSRSVLIVECDDGENELRCCDMTTTCFMEAAVKAKSFFPRRVRCLQCCCEPQRLNHAIFINFIALTLIAQALTSRHSLPVVWFGFSPCCSTLTPKNRV